MYQKIEKLRESITSDKNEQIEQVTLRLPLFAEYQQAFIDSKGDDEALGDLLIATCSGLTKSEIERLKTPDFNTLDLWAREHSTKPSEYFFTLEGEGINKDSPKLFQAIKNYTKVELKSPTVKASRMMTKVENTESNPFAQGKYLVTACSDLMDGDIDQLSMPDWNQIQLRLDDFLNQASDYFQSQI